MSTPIIFLAFANEAHHSPGRLRNLPLEQSQIQQALFDAKKQGRCEIEVRTNATLSEIMDVFQHYGDRIAVFHYGGHANSGQLLLNTDDKQGNASAHAEGFIPFLCKQEGLKLVFLNGCATQAQTALLQEAGIASIGTTQSINDEIAQKVASRFYRGLSAQNTLEQAWEDAAKEVKANHGGSLRDLVWEDEEAPEHSGLIWDARFPSKQAVWKLPAPAKPYRAYARVLGIVLPLIAIPFAYFIYRYQQMQQPVMLTVQVENTTPNPNLSDSPATIQLMYGDKTAVQEGVGKETIFKGIPSNFREKEVRLVYEAQGFERLDTSFLLEQPAITLPVSRDQSLGKVFGIVKDEDNSPLSGVKISLKNLTATTDETGNFSLEIPFEMQQEEQRVSAFKEGYNLWDKTFPIFKDVPTSIILEKK